jgi:hypothetical protein
MDTSEFSQATKRLIKHQLRIAIAKRSPIDGMADELHLFEESLQTEWQAAIRKLGVLDMHGWNTLSALAHDAYLEATREIRSDMGPASMVLDGLADFQQSFRIEDLLPPRVWA